MEEEKTGHVEMEGIEKRGRGWGEPKPKTPSGETKQWSPPKKNTTPANRKG